MAIGQKFYPCKTLSLVPPFLGPEEGVSSRSIARPVRGCEEIGKQWLRITYLESVEYGF